MGEAHGELRRIEAGRDHHGADVARSRKSAGHGTQAIDAIQVLEIRGDLVAEQGVQHVAEDLARRRRRVGSDEPRHGIQVRGPHAHDQQAVRTQVDGR